MDAKLGNTGANNREYEEFEPPFEWVKEDSFENLLVFLPGFQKDRLKIQITSAEKLRITGERPIGHNKWRHFLKEFPISPDRDTNKISAKFEGGILYVKLPKLIPAHPSPAKTAEPRQIKETTKPKPTPAPEPAELLEPNKAQKKGTTPAPALPSAADDKSAQPKQPPPPPPPQKQEEQQKEAPPPKTAAPVDKPQTGAKPKDEQHAKGINAEKKDVKDVPNNTPPAIKSRDAELLLPDSGKDEKKTPDKAEKVVPPPSSGPTEPEKKQVPDGPESGVNKDAEIKKRDVERSAKSEGQKPKGIIPWDLKKIPKTLVNVIIASLVLVVLGFYVKSGFRSFHEQPNSSAEL